MTTEMVPLEIAGYCIWVFGWIIESIADISKEMMITANAKLPKKEREPFCNVGLWYYLLSFLVLCLAHPFIFFSIFLRFSLDFF
jgi:steroid 5-alpha reductase family enzyme